MKTNRFHLLIVMILLMGFTSVYCQTLTPVISFIEFPKTHNAHITCDGKYLYTCNAGRSEDGKISKFDKEGKIISNYSIELDMRSIFYNKKDKSLYVSSYDQSIYRIVDLENGIYQDIGTEIIIDPQAVVALDPKGKLLYHFNAGTLEVYTFPEGELVSTTEGLKCGGSILTGSTTVTVSKKHYYTWNSDEQTIYAYNLKSEFVGEYSIENGSYGFSLSFADGKIFVADDGNYDEGTWYAYELGLK